MAILDIVKYPEKSLSNPSEPVDEIDDEVCTLIKDMGETMFHDSGVGLAAPQVGVNRRIIVYDARATDEERDPEAREVTALINPQIIEKSHETFISESEGCLSVVDFRADVKRHEQVKVRALNIKGKEMNFTADGILAVIMQHEIDHLDGILFIDRISALKRAMYRKKRLKQLKQEKMIRIIFMGTPDFSVPALEALADREEFEIALVVTQPDRPKGRGKKLAPSPVKVKAMALGLEVYQPEKLNTPEGIERLSSLAPDYFVVVAFGQILSQAVLDIPKVYPINIHASLLPLYRGAAPIQAAVMNRDKESGVTTMVMARGMDTGDMLLKSKTPVDPDQTAEDLHDRLAAMGADLIVETITRVNQGDVVPEPQDNDSATYVTMLKKSDGIIDWTKSRDEVRAHINAMTPWPGAFTSLNGKRLKVFRATPVPGDLGKAQPGDILSCSREGIQVAVGDGFVMISQVMGNSGKRMTADAFLRGNPIALPARFQTP